MASGSGGGGGAAQHLQLAAAWVLMASGGRGIAACPTQWLAMAPFENGQYLFADESGERVRTDRHRGLINTVWCVQILEGDSPHILLPGAYGRYVAVMPMGAGEDHIGNLITQRVLETMDTDVMWRTLPGPRDGGVVLINASSYNGVLRALRANGKYQRWNTGVSLQYFDRFNARFSSMMEWEVQVIPTRVQFQVGGAVRLCGLRRRGSGEIQVSVSVADHDGNFNIPGGEILLVSGRSLIELGSALEERFNARFISMMEWEVQVIPTRFQVGLAARLCGLCCQGSGEIQVGISVADHDGNFNVPGRVILSVPGRSLIELGSALEERFGSNFRFQDMSIFIRVAVLDSGTCPPLFEQATLSSPSLYSLAFPLDLMTLTSRCSWLVHQLFGPRHQVGIGMADYNGNFNGPCELNLSITGRSLIQRGNALEDRFGDGFSFKNFIRAGNLGQAFPLLTDLPHEIDNIDVIIFMVGTLGSEVAPYGAKHFHMELCNHEDKCNNLTDLVQRLVFRMRERLQRYGYWTSFAKAGAHTNLWPFPQANYTGPPYERNTTSVVIARANQIIVGNVGDSLSVLSRNDQVDATDALVIAKSGCFIQFFVCISGRSISLYKDRMVRIREVVDEALGQVNMRMMDSYIEYHHKILDDDNDTLFSAGVMCNTHVYVKQRFRGGRNSERGLPFPAAIPFRAYIETQGYKKERLTRWFIERKLPFRLIEPGIDDRGFFLNNSAKKCGAMLSEALESTHKCSRCFDGFEEGDIFYDPLKEELVITVPTIEFTPAAYKKDWKACKKILEKYFRYPTPGGKLIYPSMVDDMVQRIDKLEQIKNAGILWRDRVLLYRHPCFKTDAEIIGIFFQLVLHYHTLDPEERKIFESCFGEALQWRKKAELSRELKKMMNFTAYDKRGEPKLQKVYNENGGFSRIDMCRCALQHVVRPGTVDVLVMLYFIFKDLVPQMIESMLKYAPSKISEGTNKSQNHLKMIEILGFLEQGRDLR